jgi:AcrR family transcriptional regulator
MATLSERGRRPRTVRPIGNASQRKVERIIEAAQRLFVTSGFGETTMEAIALEANVGKATVYAHFGSKIDLFAAMIRLESQENFAALSSATPGSVQDDLLHFGCVTLDLLLAPSSVAYLRSIASESRRWPELGQIFFETGPEHLMRHLADYLQSADVAGTLRIPDARLASCQFFGLLVGDLHLRSLVGLSIDLPEEPRDRVVRAAVEAFLKIYAPVATTVPAKTPRAARKAARR